MLKVSLWNSLAGEWYFDTLDLPKNYTNVEGLIDTQMHKEGIPRKEWRLVSSSSIASAQTNPALPAVLTIVTEDVHPMRVADPRRHHRCIMIVNYDDQDGPLVPLPEENEKTYEIRHPSYNDGSKGKLIEYISAGSYEAAFAKAIEKHGQRVAVFAL